ncbi:hypothetical protein E2C01_095532 [Portunus trituberculatus]|uniref:Uncharacterized protein n=1 Tax=Portunus trituberculatus TaxID=210409 RepID=A0A5B7JVI3_PORTR|nr:hypothetical protein [Portunus trituberculatus]
MPLHALRCGDTQYRCLTKSTIKATYGIISRPRGNEKQEKKGSNLEPEAVMYFGILNSPVLPRGGAPSGIPPPSLKAFISIILPPKPAQKPYCPETGAKGLEV